MYGGFEVRPLTKEEFMVRRKQIEIDLYEAYLTQLGELAVEAVSGEMDEQAEAATSPYL